MTTRAGVCSHSACNYQDEADDVTNDLEFSPFPSSSLYRIRSETASKPLTTTSG